MIETDLGDNEDVSQPENEGEPTILWNKKSCTNPEKWKEIIIDSMTILIHHQMLLIISTRTSIGYCKTKKKAIESKEKIVVDFRTL